MFSPIVEPTGTPETTKRSIAPIRCFGNLVPRIWPDSDELQLQYNTKNCLRSFAHIMRQISNRGWLGCPALLYDLKFWMNILGPGAYGV